MKKLVFPLMVAVVALFAFSACTSEEETLKDKVAKINVYEGEDSDGDKCEATFTINNFSLTYPSLNMTMTSADWSIIETDSKTGSIAIKNITSEGQKLGDINGIVTDAGKKIVLNNGEIVITLTPKK